MTLKTLTQNIIHTVRNTFNPRAARALIMIGVVSQTTGCIEWFVQDREEPKDTAIVIDTDTNVDSGDSADSAIDTSDTSDSGDTAIVLPVDADADGYTEDVDCNDADATINPGATEVCDGIDQNCNNVADDSATGSWYFDGDSDGFGDASDVNTDCDGANHYVADATDCDDTRSDVNPAATEVCDGATDEDCDGSVDEGVTDTFYVDVDGDGQGNLNVITTACSAPAGYVSDNRDCDDANVAVYTGATEMCNGFDDDCDSIIDESDAIDASTFYADTDADTFGDATMVARACTTSAGYVTDATDCDDARADVNPDASEVCDGTTDENCDGNVDESTAIDASTWYADLDLDRYGDAATATVSCSAPAGFIADSADCNDVDASINPAQTEVCDEVDNDCDGTVDNNDAVDALTWYVDADTDTFGDAATSTTACTTPAGFTANDTDCDDLDGAINPAADEECDSIDNDCNGTLDDDYAIDALTWYADADLDTFGNAASFVPACTVPSGYVADDTDCNDADAGLNPGTDADRDGSNSCLDCDESDDDTYPGASELSARGTPDGVDNDCDGIVDNNTDAYDDDLDGYTEEGGDCDDTDALVSPAAIEECDLIAFDENCDGTTDDGDTFYEDRDSDSYGNAASTEVACTVPVGYTTDDTDCDDLDTHVNPAATEIENSLDDNCDGSIDEGTDADDLDLDGYSINAGDCDDATAAINPGATELCNGHDDNCDGDIDEDSAADASTWYADEDNDGYGFDGSDFVACDDPGTGFASVGGDCDDGDDLFNPGASESCDDPTDYNCDGSVTYTDADVDGAAACDDCNDADASAYPGAIEVCDSVDNDCNGLVDDDAVDAVTWYEDRDGDSFGNVDSTELSCDASADYVADATDCDDRDYHIYPGATEFCNGFDDDCDGADDTAEGVCPVTDTGVADTGSAPLDTGVLPTDTGSVPTDTGAPLDTSTAATGCELDITWAPGGTFSAIRFSYDAAADQATTETGATWIRYYQFDTSGSVTEFTATLTTADGGIVAPGFVIASFEADPDGTPATGDEVYNANAAGLTGTHTVTWTDLSGVVTTLTPTFYGTPDADGDGLPDGGDLEVEVPACTL